MTAGPVMTSWRDYRDAFDALLGATERQLLIFDRDLLALNLEHAPFSEHVRRLAFSESKTEIRMVVRSDDEIFARHPRLTRLLSDASHRITLKAVSDNLAHLTDSIVIGDGRNALVRFHQDHARSRLLSGDEELVAPYLSRFEEIWNEGGQVLTARPAGL